MNQPPPMTTPRNAKRLDQPIRGPMFRRRFSRPFGSTNFAVASTVISSMLGTSKSSSTSPSSFNWGFKWLSLPMSAASSSSPGSDVGAASAAAETGASSTDLGMSAGGCSAQVCAQFAQRTVRPFGNNNARSTEYLESHDGQVKIILSIQALDPNLIGWRPLVSKVTRATGRGPLAYAILCYCNTILHLLKGGYLWCGFRM